MITGSMSGRSYSTLSPVNQAGVNDVVSTTGLPFGLGIIVRSKLAVTTRLWPWNASGVPCKTIGMSTARTP